MFANKFQNRAAPVPAFQLERCATSEPAEPRYPKRKRAEVHYICEDAGDTDDESELEYGPPKVFEPLLPIYDALCLRNTTPARASHEVTARTQDISLHVSACRVAKPDLRRMPAFSDRDARMVRRKQRGNLVMLEAKILQEIRGLHSFG
jgi:hypothetical protein